MNARAWYNEIDPYAAQWLRNLIAAGHIAPGDVDERSIVDVRADDLAGYTQCHFFAGIGGWSLALRLAGWPDDRPVWTGSCPCPPFSSAGKEFRCPVCDTPSPVPNAVRTGAFDCIYCGHEWQADKRHLWPELFRLIRQCRPDRFFGEQVASADGRAWLDVVLASLEMAGYAAGSPNLPACGVGAPHIRQRLWFVADAGYWSHRNTCEFQSAHQSDERAPSNQRRDGIDWPSSHRSATRNMVIAAGEQVGLPGFAWEPGNSPRHMVVTDRDGRTTRVLAGASVGHGSAAIPAGRDGELGHAEGGGREGSGELRGASGIGGAPHDGVLGDARGAGLAQRPVPTDGRGTLWIERPAAAAAGDQSAALHLPDDMRLPESGTGGRRSCRTLQHALSGPQQYPDALPGLPDPWRGAEFIPCTDGKWRPVEPGTFPLAHGIPCRVGRLRAYGNAIVPQVAAEFILAAEEAMKP